MKLSDINTNSIREVSKPELLNLHKRIHQIYYTAKKNNQYKLIKFLKDLHDKIIVPEMIRRGINHRSPLK